MADTRIFVKITCLPVVNLTTTNNGVANNYIHFFKFDIFTISPFVQRVLLYLYSILVYPTTMIILA